MSTGRALYDTIGRDYGAYRRPDARLAAAITAALGTAASVVNVGAGAGSYEPVDRPVVAVEPSAAIVTTPAGRAELAWRGIRHADIIVEALLEVAGLQRAHARLRAEHGVRYVACEGGQTILAALRAARLLDEMFVTTTDVVVDRAAHEDVITTFDFAAERATLMAEGRLEPAGIYTFKRWRFDVTLP